MRIRETARPYPACGEVTPHSRRVVALPLTVAGAGCGGESATGGAAAAFPGLPSEPVTELRDDFEGETLAPFWLTDEHALLGRDTWCGFAFRLSEDFPIVETRQVLSQWKRAGLSGSPIVAQRSAAADTSSRSATWTRRGAGARSSTCPRRFPDAFALGASCEAADPSATAPSPGPGGRR